MKSLNAMNTQGKNNYTHLKRHNAIESGRINALSMLVNGEPLEIVLREIIASLESATSGLKCSINLMDKTGFALSPFVSPSLPTLLLDALQNQRVIPPYTTCAFAIANRELTVTEDITQDPHWLKIRDTALACGIRACWSQPIISPSSEVLGTFSMYLSTCGAPE